jgi:hypothetical protein
MGVAIRCILEEDVPGVPWMEGKSLAMACFGDFGAEGGELGQFIVGDAGIRWHNPAKGVAAVRSILAKLRGGATVAPPDFGFPGFGYDNEEELTEGAQSDLEELEQILVAAQKAHTRFHLAFDV